MEGLADVVLSTVYGKEAEVPEPPAVMTTKSKYSNIYADVLSTTTTMT